MGLQEAAESLLALFNASGPKARCGALLLGSVLLRHRPELPKIVLDVEED